MAIAVDRNDLGGAQALNTSGTTIATGSTTQSVAIGALVILFVGGYGTSVTSISVTGGPLTGWTYHQPGHAANPAAPFPAIAYARAPSGLGTGQTWTVTYNASSQVRTISAASVLGVDTVDPLGNVAGPVGVSPAAAGWSTGNVSIEARSMLVGFCWNEATNTGSTPGQQEFNEVGHTDGFRHVAGYRIEDVAGTYAVSGTWGAIAQSTTIGIELRAAPEAALIEMVQSKRMRPSRSFR